MRTAARLLQEQPRRPLHRRPLRSGNGVPPARSLRSQTLLHVRGPGGPYLPAPPPSATKAPSPVRRPSPTVLRRGRHLGQTVLDPEYLDQLFRLPGQWAVPSPTSVPRGAQPRALLAAPRRPRKLRHFPEPLGRAVSAELVGNPKALIADSALLSVLRPGRVGQPGPRGRRVGEVGILRRLRGEAAPPVRHERRARLLRARPDERTWRRRAWRRSCSARRTTSGRRLGAGSR
jgi:hypothetical protein